MKRTRCKYCRAKTRTEFMTKYRGIEMCHDCSHEYKKIFDGYKNKAERKAICINPMFEAFKKGWRLQEKESGLNPLPIPKSIEEYYAVLWIKEKAEWTSKEIDSRMLEDGFSWSKRRFDQQYREVMGKLKDDDGISKDS